MNTDNRFITIKKALIPLMRGENQVAQPLDSRIPQIELVHTKSKLLSL